eukprot:TRINITY_DN63752_c0_g1_i1.p1 TRINITY_DN63752_c0_g1~~TRINITY_DN63752_c0_g1_i1.p1  ORF type:complete len:503 (-),score=127.15 TRINITY_DN63752_c0_g1_i1:26-1534(-)
MSCRRQGMAPSPGTGLVTHEAKSRGKGSKGRYSKDAPSQELCTGKTLAEQEEERVNGRLVEILERKCSKLRCKVDEEERAKLALEQELQQLRKKLDDRDKQVADLCAAQRDLAQDRQTAMERGSAMEGLQQECKLAQKALRQREEELRALQQRSAQAEEQWKSQVLKLVEELQKAGHRSDGLEKELEAKKAELAQLKTGAQDVVRRYEEESARRLELESRCLELDEKLKGREQRSRGDSDAAHQKVKQSLQAKQRAEELSQKHEERTREALRRAEEAELRCAGLDAEVQKIRSLCAERGRRLQQLEARLATAEAELPSQQLEAQSTQQSEELHLPMVRPTATAVPSRNTRPSSRPGTGGSTASYGSSGRPPSSGSGRPPSSGSIQMGEARLPPGAIRRGGSVPARRPQSQAHPLASVQARSSSPAANHPQRPGSGNSQVALGFGAGIARVAAAEHRPSSRAGSRPSSSHAASEADLGIEDQIPSDPDDSSSEEVLTAVRRSG